MPRPDQPGLYLLRFDVAPATDGERAVSRKLAVSVNGTQVGEFEVRERVSLECPVEWELIQRSSAMRIDFQHPDYAGLDGSGERLAFATLILFRVGEIGSAGTGGSAPARPSPSREPGGYVDLCGYSELARGWFIVGWVSTGAANGQDPAALGRALTGVVARFGDENVSAEAAVAFYPRDDLEDRGLGFTLLLPADRGRKRQLTALDLEFADARPRLHPADSMRSLAEDEATDWITQSLRDPKTAPAMKTLLLRATVGREVDGEYYLARYGDVRKAGADAAEHYFNHGCRENRDPNHWFCTRDYLDLYPDVAAEGYNPLYHYIVYGKAEGRRPHDRSAEWAAISGEFDVAFYFASNPDVAELHLEPIQHYIDSGWRERRDPTPWFSTRFYLDHQHDIRKVGRNPFHHYLQYGRKERRKPCNTRFRPYKPLVSVIVPSYNHAEFLGERLDSILQQTYENIEVVVIDDASADRSRDVIESYRQRYPDRVRSLYNQQNSGSVFHQWRQGLLQVRGELVWICESDDSCERDFAETLVPYFADSSIMLAFGRIQFIDPNGVESRWLDTYRESAGPGIWSDVHIAPAHEWFRGCFAIRNVIPNVGGCLFRRQTLPDPVWDQAMRFRTLGDWFLYAHLAGGGRLAYDPKAASYFRLHSANTSVRSLSTEQYYLEHLWLGTMMRQRFGTPDEVSLRFYGILSDQYAESFGSDRRNELRRLVDLEEILRTRQTQKHILIAIYGLHTGGAEVFAIHLANQLVELGYIVSVLCAMEHLIVDNEGMRRMLDPRIAIYDRDMIDEIGLESFLASAGVDIVNSHFIEAEYLFFAGNGGRLKIPYVVTMHGAYELYELSDADLLAFMRGVDYWIYTAQKNLGHFTGIPIAQERTLSLPNALIVNEGPFPFSRQDVGADDSAVIFGLASRAVLDKGWEESIRALHLAQQETGRRLVLLFCGDGPELERLEPLHQSDPNIRFLGFQQNIHGFYRLCDCCLLPSRFGGESFPLSLVQSLQVGTPVIATDVGEIRSMVEGNGTSAGILLQLNERRDALVRALANAMVRMSDDAFRAARRSDAAAMGNQYDMVSLAHQYLAIFAKAANW